MKVSETDFTLDQEDVPLFYEPVVLTIGTFDGVHTGHQFLLKTGKIESEKRNSNLVVLTFRTPPSWFFSPETKKPLIMTLEERIQWLKYYGADHILVMDFTEDVAKRSALNFLTLLNTKISILKLFLGHDGKIGSDQENNRQQVFVASQKLGFDVEFLPSYLIDGQNVSSSRIRSLLESGEPDAAKRLLGHEINSL